MHIHEGALAATPVCRVVQGCPVRGAGGAWVGCCGGRPQSCGPGLTAGEGAPTLVSAGCIPSLLEPPVGAHGAHCRGQNPGLALRMGPCLQAGLWVILNRGGLDSMRMAGTCCAEPLLTTTASPSMQSMAAEWGALSSCFISGLAPWGQG